MPLLDWFRRTHESSGTATANGIAMRYRDEGQGEPILLVHAFPLSSAMWEDQIDALSARFRVIAPDLRGFGGTARGAGMASLDQAADDLAALLDALKIDHATVVGLSMGGYIAFALLRRHPAAWRAWCWPTHAPARIRPKAARAASKARSWPRRRAPGDWRGHAAQAARFRRQRGRARRSAQNCGGERPRRGGRRPARMPARPDSAPDLAALHIPHRSLWAAKIA